MDYRFQRTYAELQSGHNVTVQLKREDPVPVFFQQGDIDGACGLYVFAMVLAIFGLAKASALEEMPRRKYGVPAEVWAAFQHTYFTGVNHDEYVQLIRSLDLPLAVALQCGDTGSIDRFAVECLMRGELTALAFSSTKNQHTKHWALAIGIEGRVFGKDTVPDTLLLLDPSAPGPVFSTFNARLRLPPADRRSRRKTVNLLKRSAIASKQVQWLYGSSAWPDEQCRLLAAVRFRLTDRL
jgi:hypothetical protein